LVEQHLAILHLLIDLIPGVSQWMDGDPWSTCISDDVTRGLGEYSGHFLLFGLNNNQRYSIAQNNSQHPQPAHKTRRSAVAVIADRTAYVCCNMSSPHLMYVFRGRLRHFRAFFPMTFTATCHCNRSYLHRYLLTLYSILANNQTGFGHKFTNGYYARSNSTGRVYERTQTIYSSVTIERDRPKFSSSRSQ